MKGGYAMSENHVIGLLEDHLSSNEWMILSVGDLNSRAYQYRFRIGQTLHNNQYAVVELAEIGYFPGGTIFAVKPRPRRKGRGGAVLSFIEVHDGELAEREFVDVMDRVNWSRVIGIIKGRIRWEKRIAEHCALELEMEESLDLNFQLYVSVESASRCSGYA
jgi:hypothetical protein